MTATEQYFLTGPLNIVAAADAAQPHCIFVGHRAFHGSARAANLLRAVAETATLAGIVERFNALDGSSMTAAQARQILTEQLLPAGLIAHAATATAASSAHKILFVSATLLSERVVARLCPWFSWLFAVPAALLAGGLGTLALSWWLYARLGSGAALFDPAMAMDMTPAESLLFCALLAATFLLHELGHAAATFRWGQKPAEIGIGLYLIFPVLFSNVTSAWALSRRRRIAVNLGGIYLQGLATACLVPFQLAGGSPVLALVIVTNLFSIAINLNPFFRFDGYWIYSDLFGLPNLREQARAWAMQRTIAWFGHARQSAPAADVPPLALRIYAIAAPLFFTGFTLWAAWHAIGFYPAFAAILDATLQRSPGVSSFEAVLDAVGSWAMLGLYVVAYILSGLYILSSLVRTFTFLRSAAGQSRAARIRMGKAA